MHQEHKETYIIILIIALGVLFIFIVFCYLIYKQFQKNRKLFTEKLNADLHKKAIMQHMTAEDTKSFVGADNNSLHIGAITHSDAVVLADENLDNDVLKFVKDSNKPTLAFNLTENYENFFAFYEEISDEELVSVA